MLINKRLAFSQEELNTFSLLHKKMDDIAGCRADNECDNMILLTIKSHLNELAREVEKCHALVDEAIETLNQGENDG